MNYTTYYRKDIWKRFKDEPDKSDLINRLLAEHYDDVAVEKVIKKVSAEPKNIIKPAIIGAEWSGPIMRDKKKNKL